MSLTEKYVAGPASKAQVLKDGEKWTLLLVRELRHPPDVVWEALTDPAQLSAWAPFDASRSLASTGPVELTTVGAPVPQVATAIVKQAERPSLLEYDWGGQNLRWELEPLGTGTRLRLSHNIDRRFIAWGAAGWHVCFDVMERLLADAPIGRIVGAEARNFSGWQRLTAEYARQFETDASHSEQGTQS